MHERDQLIWMAGFFDGEGCVSVGRQKPTNPNKTTREYYYYTLHVVVANRSEESCRSFHQRFGGTVYEFSIKGVTYWRWNCWSNEAMVALEKMLPYLTIKRPVAEVGIRFQSHKESVKRPYGRKGYPEEITMVRDAMYHEARALNAKNRTNNKAPKYEGPKMLALKRVNEV